MVSRGPNLRRHNDRNDSKLEYVNETKNRLACSIRGPHVSFKPQVVPVKSQTLQSSLSVGVL